MQFEKLIIISIFTEEYILYVSKELAFKILIKFFNR